MYNINDEDYSGGHFILEDTLGYLLLGITFREEGKIDLHQCHGGWYAGSQF